MAVLLFACLPACAIAGSSDNSTEQTLELRNRFTTDTRLQVHVKWSQRDDSLRKSEFGAAINHRMNSHWSYRVGARYIDATQGTLTSGEYRGVLALQYTRKFAEKWTLSNRSQLDLRWVQGKPFSQRLRDRVTLAHANSIAGHEFSPYASYEVYYDSRYDRLTTNRTRVGVTVPLGRAVTLTAYGGRTDQNYPTHSATDTVGITLVFLLDGRKAAESLASTDAAW